MILDAILLSIAEIMSRSKDPKSPQPQCSVAILPSMKMRKVSFTSPVTGYGVCISESVDYEDSGDNKGKLLDSITRRYHVHCS